MAFRSRSCGGEFIGGVVKLLCEGGDGAVTDIGIVCVALHLLDADGLVVARLLAKCRERRGQPIPQVPVGNAAGDHERVFVELGGGVDNPFVVAE